MYKRSKELPKVFNFSSHIIKNEKKLKILFLLDLDSTMISTKDEETVLDHTEKDLKNNEYYNIPINNGDRGEGIFELPGVFRPGYKKFLKYIFNTFEYIGVWSAGEYGYVHRLCDLLCRDTREFDIIFTRNDCTKGENGDTIKPLEKLIKKASWLEGISLKNTLILDDKTHTFEANLNNGVLIPEWCPDVSVKDKKYEDNAFEELLIWFNTSQFKNFKDVRKLNKDNIFQVNIL